MVAPERDTIGRYELLLELGRGGMAVLYLARARGVGGFARLFAIKRILPHLAADPMFVDMFLDEGRIAARLSHPNLCPVFELGHDRGELFLVMEYLDGVPWEALVAAAPRDGRGLALAAGVLAQACEGLHHAHTLRDVDGTAMPIVHRDVSPQNLFVSSDGVCRVLDFGVSKIATDHRRTRTGVHKGKLPYMAPEQISGEPVDGRTDVWAIGVLLWEALTGEHLFDRDTDFLIYQAISSEPIPSVNAAFAAGPDATATARIRTGPGNAAKGSGPSGGIGGAATGIGYGSAAADISPGGTATGIGIAPVTPAPATRRYPDAVDHVIARALSRDRRQRYPTARDLGRDLLQLAERVGGAASREAIAEAVLGLCGDQVAARKRAISAAVARRAASETAANRSGAAADATDTSGAATRATPDEPSAPRDAAETASMAMRRDAIVVQSRRRNRWIVPALAVAALAGGIALVARLTGPSAPSSNGGAEPGDSVAASPDGPSTGAERAVHGRGPRGSASATLPGESRIGLAPPANGGGARAVPAAASRGSSDGAETAADGDEPRGGAPARSPSRASNGAEPAANAGGPRGAGPARSSVGSSAGPREAFAGDPRTHPASDGARGAQHPDASRSSSLHPAPTRTSSVRTAHPAAADRTTPDAGSDRASAPTGAPAAAAATGWYAIDSAPYATIYIDGRKIGDTPLDRIAVPAGVHGVRAVLADGRQRNFSIEIAAGGKTSSGTLAW